MSAKTKKTESGWYRSAVTVRFECRAGTAALAPAKPRKAAAKFRKAGMQRSMTKWTAKVRIAKGQRPGRWHVGVRIGKKTHVVKVSAR